MQNVWIIEKGMYFQEESGSIFVETEMFTLFKYYIDNLPVK